MKNIAVIIPVHKYDNSIKEMLLTAINSVPEDKQIYISCPKEISALITIDVPDNIEIFDNTNNKSFQALVNSAVKELKDIEWFSILEFDDEYTNYWFNEVDKYIEFYPETSIFLPLTDLIREIDGQKKFVGYGNEAPLASAFSNELGYIDLETLENYFDFYLTGSVINVNDYLNNGLLKESMKLTFWYEFMMRLANKNKKIQVIPKVGYKHLIGRNDSLYALYNDTLSQKESEWWYNLAKKEYKHIEDRNKQYEKEKEK